METVVLTREGPIARVTLNRPEVRNALDQPAIAALTKIFTDLAGDDALRLVVLDGAGSVFCGGADIKYMQASLAWSQQENFDDALRLSHMFRAINECPVPVLAKVQGAALGGGAGLLVACDSVIASDDAIFGFTEVKLGIVPAVISPFVVRKIGETHARALFTTGERFDATRALRIGLVHEVVPAAGLDAAVQRKVEESLSAGPQAARTAKEIAKTVGSMPLSDAQPWTARRIAERRASAEGQEGLRAFIEKRKPNWR
ncbi:MAG TPA: enoyl-CoA hydratase-related protein [Candidatus Tumulicola sp.]|nr:enoyl-CoA hydratase-related protein [Candidatus Tumulicola sp.]